MSDLASCCVEKEDALFGGVEDSFFDDITIVEEEEEEEEEQDAIFGGIPDELLNEAAAATIQFCVESNQNDLFEELPDEFFDTISLRGPSFIDLPPEIRNMIYKIVFVSPANIGTQGMTRNSFIRDVVKWRNLDFAMSCRQIYDESINIFYVKNGFEFYYIRPFKEFMESIGIERRRLITKLNFNFLKGSPFCVLRYIRSCTNLKDLSISLRVIKPNCEGQGWWLYPVKDAKEFLFTDSDKLEFGEAIGVGEARDSEARDECKVGHCEKTTLFTALRKVKSEDIYTPNGRYPSIFAQRKSARQITEEYHNFSERYERERNLQWRELKQLELELDISYVSPAALMRDLLNLWR